jgi:hypothetical protein
MLLKSQQVIENRGVAEGNSTLKLLIDIKTRYSGSHLSEVQEEVINHSEKFARPGFPAQNFLRQINTDKH